MWGGVGRRSKGQQQKQIPSLRFGMTKQKGRETARAEANTEIPGCARNDGQRARCGVSTARRTVELSGASVEMTTCGVDGEKKQRQ